MPAQSSPTQSLKRFEDSTRQDLRPADDVVQYLKDYARARPDVAALWCFGVGFILGWKLKPW